MRVLLIHNRYSSRVPSGENTVVDAEARWLEEAGVAVSRHEVSNDVIFDGGLRTRAGIAVSAAWSRRQARQLGAIVEAERPDVVHVHNLFPIFTGSVAWAATRTDLPVVWTVHNYRASCIGATRFRNGSPCDLCRRGWKVPGVVFGCYSGSRLVSLTTTVGSALFTAVAKRRLTTLAVSDHVRGWLLAQGFDPARTRTKYNGVPGPDELPAGTSPATSRTVLFLGKLAEEKGIRLILDAWRQVRAPDIRLRVVGSGPLSAEVTAAARADDRIEAVGQVPRSEVSEHLFAARSVLVPSIWEEPFPLAALEALAHGRPIVTTARGGLGDMVDESCSWRIEPRPEALATALTDLFRSDAVVVDKGRNGRAEYERRFTPDVTTKQLIEIYQEAIAAGPAGPATESGRLRDGEASWSS